MTGWREFFKRNCNFLFYSKSFATKPFGVDELYQAFNARRESEAKEKLTKVFGPVGCRCPRGAGGWCKHFSHKDDEVCNHPSNKPPEPECEHRQAFNTYEQLGHKYCRDCGRH